MRMGMNKMITLRPNQREPIRKAVEFFNNKYARPSLIVLPTAWGKSILTAFVARECKDKLLVVQPSKELLEQNYAKYKMLCGDIKLNAAIYSASVGQKEIGDITYATIGSIKNIGSKFKELGFTKMLIDEAHLYPREADSMLGTFLKDSGITHVLGITATPIKLQTNYDKDGNIYSKLVMLTSRSYKGNFFKTILHVTQVKEMVDLKFWSPLKYVVDDDFDSSKLMFNSTGSEYTAESIHSAFNANKIEEKITTTLNKLTERKHILVFVPSVEDAEKLSNIYPNSAFIHGMMKKKERADIIGRFRSGNIRVIFNVRVLSTGFDYTGIDCIILGISTASVALYYQIIGRATRIDPNKKDALIVDFGGNVKRFGHVEDITFEPGSVWRMFGTGKKLLSGIPIKSIGSITEDYTKFLDEINFVPIEVMPFGKYKGEQLKDIPRGYRQWMIDKFTWSSPNDRLRMSLLKLNT